jgi:hypothetical protein
MTDLNLKQSKYALGSIHDKENGSLLIKNYAMKAYWGVDV